MSIGRRLLYFFLLIGFGVSVAVVLLNRKPAPIPELKARRGTAALSGEWLNTREAVTGLQAKLRQNPDDHDARLQLAQLYVQEGRITGDHPYYDAAALRLLNDVLRDQPKNFEALCTKAVVSLSQHHFAQGLRLAQQAAELNPYNGFVQGLLCDAYVELGRYPEAVQAADRMNQLRPDLRAYARVAYLREIHGDLNGAKEAMLMAVKAGVPGFEQTEWCRVMLGHLLENTGDLASAEAAYQESLQLRPGYAYALAGLARVARARQDYDTGIEHLQLARAQVRDYAFTDELTDLYRLNRQPDKAAETAQKVIETLKAHANTEDEDDSEGHYTDRELAYAYLKAGQLELALQHAKTEYERRPTNIDVCETMAWVHYRRGEFRDAQRYMQQARRTGCQNPQLLYRAGCIAVRNGDVAGGQALLRQARTLNPHLQTDPAEAPPQQVAAR